MASLQKIYTQPKLLGQIYTPNFIVEKILDDVGFDSVAVLQKKIIDPACGDGRFLCEVARRIIAWSSPENLAENLTHLYGWDIDDVAISACKMQLDELILPYNVSINWNVFTCDALAKKTDFEGHFDFVVGNPPYIRIQHLEIEQRQYIQQHFSFCKNGSTDIFIAFFELAFSLLSDSGKCGFITPNSYLFTSTANVFRAFFAEKKLLQKITNYGDIQLFENATTYTAITIFSKKEQDVFLFEKAITNRDFEVQKIEIASLQNAKIWQLPISKPLISNDKNVLLKNICKIHVGITTLCDKAYIFPIIAEENDKIVVVNSRLQGLVRLEKAILRSIIKGSLLKNSEQKISEFVLFPYQKNATKTAIIPEHDLQKNYPLAYEYLLSVKEILDARDNGAPNAVAWYAFGRSQGLETSFGKKIIFSPMNLRPNFIFYADENCTFYSGYCIKYSGDNQALLDTLNSQRMADFIAVSSRDFRGGWKAYSKKTIEDFEVSEELLVQSAEPSLFPL